MPQLEITTKAAKSVWKSPDGQREIFELVMEYDGKDVNAKSYSKEIATEGWSGTVETYEKEGRNGLETFVKQPPKEGGFSTRSGTSGSSGRGSYGAGKPGDQFTMYLSYAKDLVVALQQTVGYEEKAFKQLLAATVQGGSFLYANRPEATGSKPEAEKPAKEEDEQIDMTLINEMFKEEE